MTLGPVQYRGEKEISWSRVLTELSFKDMRSVTRLNEHNLILVGEVEWLGVVQGNRKVERGSVNLGDRRELGNARIFLSDQLRPPESKLRVAGVASRDKHRAIIDRNGDHIFGTTEWVAPERGWVKSATHELGVLDLV